MCKIGLIAFAAALLLSGASFGAEKITLTCSVTTMIWAPPYTKMPNPDESLVVDLDKGIVETQFGAITEAAENHISFAGAGVKQWQDWQFDGRIDRVSGSAYVNQRRGTRLMYTDNLTCKPTKPLF